MRETKRQLRHGSRRAQAPAVLRRGASGSGLIREYPTTLWGIGTRALEVEGSEPAPTFLLLHGFLDSADTWRPVLERLAAAGRSAIAYDMPGFGFAERARHGGLLDQQESFVAEAVRRVAAKSGRNVVVAGNSLGGWVTLRIGAHQNLPLAAIAPIAPAGLDMSPWFFRAERIPAADAIVDLPVPIPSRVTRDIVSRTFRQLAFCDQSKVDEPSIRRFAFHNRDRATVRWRINAARRLITDGGSAYHPERIMVPTTVIWGDKDLLCLPSGAKRLSDEIVGSRLAMLHGCGHCPQLEEPGRTAELLLETAPTKQRAKPRLRRYLLGAA